MTRFPACAYFPRFLGKLEIFFARPFPKPQHFHCFPSQSMQNWVVIN